jgi:hypothetical protein
MTLVNYAYHAAVTDGKDWLSKLRTFATGQGWTGADYQTSVQWSSGWIAGSGDFLQLESTCYGSCDKAVYRFFVENHDANEDQLDHSANTTNSYAGVVDTPMVQDRWGGQVDMYGTSMPSSAQGIDKAWFFGNGNYIYAVAQFDDYIVPTWHMGTIDLYPEYRTRTDCAFWGTSNYQEYPLVRNFAWNLHDPDFWWPGLLPSWDYAGALAYFDCVYFSGQAQNRTDEGASYSFWIEDTAQTERGAYNWCKNVARTYGPNARRIAFKVDFFGLDTSLGQVVPLGKTPFYVIPFNGLAPGDTITENGMSYLCFPFCFTWFNLGFAFRIA